MSTFASDSGPQNAPIAARKINKACVPCRARKVRCDAVIVGLPCTSCSSRQCTSDCLFLERKGRTRKRTPVLPTPTSTTQSPTIPSSRRSEDQSRTSSPSDLIDCQTPDQTGPDLLYLQILNDTVDETAESRSLGTASTICSKSGKSLTPRNCLSAKLPYLDHIDREYLAKKGVFDLPPSHHLDTLVKTYFDHVHPFSPVINKAEFIRCYKSGDCSLLLLRVILTTAILLAPENVLSDCGFADRSTAQKSFFLKANLLYDFATGDDLLSLLQASIILCLVILDHPTDRDFGYWFHNAIHLATKLDLRKICIQEGKPHKALKLYRSIWWALYSLDTFHVSMNTKRSLLIDDVPVIKPSMEDIWEDEDVSGTSYGLPSVITAQQKTSLAAHRYLCQIFRQCLSIMTKKAQQDPSQMTHPLDEWRKSFNSKMHADNLGTDPYYISIQALSYRFECILCRQVRQESKNAEWTKFAKQRLRSAMLELVQSS